MGSEPMAMNPTMNLRFVQKYIGTADNIVLALQQQWVDEKEVQQQMLSGWSQPDAYEWRDVPVDLDEPIVAATPAGRKT
jgi:hypothetical protein